MSRVAFTFLAVTASLLPPSAYLLYLLRQQNARLRAELDKIESTQFLPPPLVIPPPKEYCDVSTDTLELPKRKFDPKMPNPFAVRPFTPRQEILAMDVEFGVGGALARDNLLYVAFASKTDFYLFPLHKPDGTLPDLDPLAYVLQNNSIFACNPESGDIPALQSLGLDTSNIRDFLKLSPVGPGTGAPGPSLKSACEKYGVVYRSNHALGEAWSLMNLISVVGVSL